MGFTGILLGAGEEVNNPAKIYFSPLNSQR